MSLNSLINEQIKQVLNRNTNTVINSISEKLDISKDMLVDIWNKLNIDFKIKNKSFNVVPEIIDEDIPIVPVIIDEDIPIETRIEIIDEDFLV
jgi:hypothetical protein